MERRLMHTGSPDWLDTLALAVTLFGLLHAVLLAVYSYEMIRSARSRLRTAPLSEDAPVVELFVPCKGHDPEFDQTIGRILNLDYPVYRVTFVVESVSDPAHARLARLLAAHHGVPARIVVAGLAQGCGQKVHNLIEATAQAAADAAVLAFADSDAIPSRDWLRRLVAPLASAKYGVVTGNRWFNAPPGQWPGAILSAMNASVALGVDHLHLCTVWGGAWAMRREDFERMQQAGVWRGALTEDLPTGQWVRRQGLRVRVEPGCIVATSAGGDTGQLIEFARRQLLITRVYDRKIWIGLFLAAAVGVATFGLGLSLTLACAVTGRPWLMPAVFFAMTYLIHCVRALARQRLMARRFQQHFGRQLSTWLDIFGHPLMVALNLVLMVSTAWGREITWRHIRYRMHDASRTQILARRVA